MRMTSRLCLVSWLFAMATAWGFTQPKLVMVTEEWPPFRINDSAQPSGFRGIDIDLTLRLEKALGVSIEIQRCPWARALELMRGGQADLITGIARTEEREQFIMYVPTSYYSVRPVFYARKGSGVSVRSYEDLGGKSIGYSLHSAYFEPFNSDGGLKKVGLSSEAQILKMLSGGRIDLAIGTEPNISWDISRLGYRGTMESTAYRPPDRTDLFIGVSRKSPALAMVPSIDAVIRAMLADGSMDAILAAYR